MNKNAKDPVEELKMGDGKVITITADSPVLKMNADLQSIVDTIRTYNRDIDTTSRKINVAKEELAEICADWDETEELEEATEALAAARESFKRRSLQSAEYNTKAENIANMQTTQKDQRQILSDYLVAYFARTGERQVLLYESTGDGRQVVVSAKLGKEEKYQTNLFSQAEEL